MMEPTVIIGTHDQSGAALYYSAGSFEMTGHGQVGYDHVRALDAAHAVSWTSPEMRAWFYSEETAAGSGASASQPPVQVVRERGKHHEHNDKQPFPPVSSRVMFSRRVLTIALALVAVALVVAIVAVAKSGSTNVPAVTPTKTAQTNAISSDVPTLAQLEGAVKSKIDKDFPGNKGSELSQVEPSEVKQIYTDWFDEEAGEKAIIDLEKWGGKYFFLTTIQLQPGGSQTTVYAVRTTPTGLEVRY